MPPRDQHLGARPERGTGGPSARVLAVNVGSSSVKFAFFTGGEPPARVLSGQVEKTGSSSPTLHFTFADGESTTGSLPPGKSEGVNPRLLDWFGTLPEFNGVVTVVHRLVHGGPNHRAPERVTPELLDDLDRLVPLDPGHLPAALAMIRAFGTRFPRVPQLVCFDTAFHADLPRVARRLPIPRRYEAAGVRRYGFHGLSYAFLLGELRRLDGETAANGRIILAHLGNGASMAAVRGGRCLDTSMGFTPAAGLPMGTRSGDLDPGLFPYLARTEGMTAEGFDHLVNHQSGLLGLSETTSDVRELLARESDDPRAAEALACFCYQARKWVGSFAAALGGLDALVFAGGIGERAAPVRARICEGLGFLGLQLDDALNAANAPRISSANGRVNVRVIPTDEEIVLARSALSFAAIP